MYKGRANIVIDGQWGSTGKGKLSGYLALRNEVALSTCDFMSNAGHTYISDDGNKIVTCQLPTAAVNEDTMLVLNAGAGITVSRLLQEIEELDCADRVYIHPHAAVITQDDRDHEASVLGRISSTLKGCGGSTARKVMRTAKLAKDEPSLKQWVTNTDKLTHAILETGGTVLVEGAQGFDLSLNHGWSYPFVTSRDVTPMSILNNAAIPFGYLGDVYGTLRTFPIRVGNTYDANGVETGNSGPFYNDQREITWDELQKASGADHSLLERTTVTQKVRRVFTFSNEQLERFVQFCRPTKLFLNFVNHVDAGAEGCRSWSELPDPVQTFVHELNSFLYKYAKLHHFPHVNVNLLGTGAKDSDMVVL